jgi:intracellular sulfur oxidation DsrE/DsrF family protein
VECNRWAFRSETLVYSPVTQGLERPTALYCCLYGDAAYLVLNDDSYNPNRHVQTGNRYRKLIAGVMKQGVQIESCDATTEANRWINSNLLPGAMVDTDAMVRVTQLEQGGFILVYE